MDLNMVLGAVLVVVGVIDFAVPSLIKSLPHGAVIAVRIGASGFMLVGLALLAGYLKLF
jgi:hypothetical protein